MTKQAALALVTSTAERQTEEVSREQPPPRGPIPEVMIIDEAAQFLRISTRTLVRLIQAKLDAEALGLEPAKIVSGAWDVRRDGIGNWR